MKKVLISLGSLLILALVVVLFVNANQGETKKGKKAEVEMKSDCCSSTPACTHTWEKQEAAAAEKSGCDPATCPGHASEMTADTKTVDPKDLKSTCHSKLTEPR